jgi:large subunit ribosomal protein L20
MTRVKRGYVLRKRHKKILKLAQGFRGSGSDLFRSSIQRVSKALRFSYGHRRLKKIQFRQLWISRINAAVRHFNLNYSVFIYCFKQKNGQVNRKWLSQLAVRRPLDFEQLMPQNVAIATNQTK